MKHQGHVRTMIFLIAFLSGIAPAFEREGRGPEPVWAQTGESSGPWRARSQKAQAAQNNQDELKVAVVLVGHGLPARDFPRERLREFRRLMGQVMEAGGEEKAPADLVARLHALERQMRQWKRTPENDPYNAAVEELAEQIRQRGGYDLVAVAHNEACGLDVDEAIEAVIRQGARRILVVPTMLIKGGTHSERDIPQKIEKARRAHPEVSLTYVWPIETERIAELLVEQLARFR